MALGRTAATLHGHAANSSALPRGDRVLEFLQATLRSRHHAQEMSGEVDLLHLVLTNLHGDGASSPRLTTRLHETLARTCTKTNSELFRTTFEMSCQIIFQLGLKSHARS